MEENSGLLFFLRPKKFSHFFLLFNLKHVTISTAKWDFAKQHFAAAKIL